jgi:hypothetical protein
LRDYRGTSLLMDVAGPEGSARQADVLLTPVHAGGERQMAWWSAMAERIDQMGYTYSIIAKLFVLS